MLKPRTALEWLMWLAAPVVGVGLAILLLVLLGWLLGQLPTGVQLLLVVAVFCAAVVRAVFKLLGALLDR